MEPVAMHIEYYSSRGLDGMAVTIAQLRPNLACPQIC
jgi:hypothetical protein